VNDRRPVCGPADLVAALDRGEQPDEGVLTRALRAPSCPPELVESLAARRWVVSLRRVLPLLLGHPRCPRHFALETVPRLGWRELAALSARPQASPVIRRQAERKLLERLPHLTLGERCTLARLGAGQVRAALVRDADSRCIAALLENPRLTEGEVVRLLAVNQNPECGRLVLGHGRWGTASAIRAAALRSATVPRATLLGLLATLSMPELARVAGSPDVPADVRRWAAELLGHRKDRRCSAGGRRPPCAPRNAT